MLIVSLGGTSGDIGDFDGPIFFGTIVRIFYTCCDEVSFGSILTGH